MVQKNKCSHWENSPVDVHTKIQTGVGGGVTWCQHNSQSMKWHLFVWVAPGLLVSLPSWHIGLFLFSLSCPSSLLLVLYLYLWLIPCVHTALLVDRFCCIKGLHYILTFVRLSQSSHAFASHQMFPRSSCARCWAVSMKCQLIDILIDIYTVCEVCKVRGLYCSYCTSRLWWRYIRMCFPSYYKRWHLNLTAATPLADYLCTTVQITFFSCVCTCASIFGNFPSQPRGSERKKLALALNAISIDLAVVHLNWFHTSARRETQNNGDRKWGRVCVCWIASGLSSGLKLIPYLVNSIFFPHHRVTSQSRYTINHAQASRVCVCVCAVILVWMQILYVYKL